LPGQSHKRGFALYLRLDQSCCHVLREEVADFNQSPSASLWLMWSSAIGLDLELRGEPHSAFNPAPPQPTPDLAPMPVARPAQTSTVFALPVPPPGSCLLGFRPDSAAKKASTKGMMGRGMFVLHLSDQMLTFTSAASGSVKVPVRLVKHIRLCKTEVWHCRITFVNGCLGHGGALFKEQIPGGQPAWWSTFVSGACLQLLAFNLPPAERLELGERLQKWGAVLPKWTAVGSHTIAASRATAPGAQRNVLEALGISLDAGRSQAGEAPPPPPPFVPTMPQPPPQFPPSAAPPPDDRPDHPASQPHTDSQYASHASYDKS
jgi:hypothetical protein